MNIKWQQLSFITLLNETKNVHHFPRELRPEKSAISSRMQTSNSLSSCVFPFFFLSAHYALFLTILFIFWQKIYSLFLYIYWFCKLAILLPKFWSSIRSERKGRVFALILQLNFFLLFCSYFLPFVCKFKKEGNCRRSLDMA